MKTIEVEELEHLQTDSIQLIDVRSAEEVARGAIPGAVNMPGSGFDQDFDQEAAKLDPDRPVYLICHSGRKSAEIGEDLEEKGFDVINVKGGYRAWLCMNLERQQARITEEERTIRRKEIERSIIKKYRKSIWRGFTKGVTRYKLIEEGDKIAVCISGGKDSMLMAKLFQEIQRHGKFHFDLVFLCMNPGYNEENWKIIENNADILGIPLTVFHSDIFDIVADVDKNPCYLCARMRRGFLYAHAKELGCNKIALGHHFDDVIETILMGMLYSGKVETMMPKLHSQNFEGMELIRPMYMIKEEDIKSWRDYNDLHFIQCACRFTEHCATCGGTQPSKREEMKKLIAEFRKTSDVIDTNIFNSVQNINLQTVIGYHKGDWSYNFLDDYDDK